MIQIEWAGERLALMPEKAVWWIRRSTLLIADPHLGKAHAFRARGVPVPSGTTAANLDRLTDLLAKTRAARLVVLGDFFHAKDGVAPPVLEQVADWRRRHNHVAVQVVRGNHDRHAGDPPADLDIACVEEGFTMEPLTLCHEPCEVEEGFVLAGHVHPAVRLHPTRGAGGGMRLPCFHFDQRVGVLPAFGAFTGMHPIRPKVGERVFAVGPDEVLEVTPTPGSVPGSDPGTRQGV